MKFHSVVFYSAATLALVSNASATNLDCTTGCNEVAQFGGVWSTTEVQPAGTGNIDSFVQLQNTPEEQGYNTIVDNVFDNKSSDVFNHELLLSAVPIKTILGVDYREFLLDLHESENGRDNYISLDGLQFYLSDTPNQSTTNVSSLGALVYDVDAGTDNRVLLDAEFIGSGSGASDLFVYIPNALFIAAAASVTLADPYVYLWSQFGLFGVQGNKNFGSNATFEEWAVRTPSGAVPEPTTMLLLASSGAVLLRRRSARKGA